MSGAGAAGSEPGSHTKKARVPFSMVSTSAWYASSTCQSPFRLPERNTATASEPDIAAASSLAPLPGASSHWSRNTWTSSSSSCSAMRFTRCASAWLWDRKSS